MKLCMKKVYRKLIDILNFDQLKYGVHIIRTTPPKQIKMKKLRPIIFFQMSWLTPMYSWSQTTPPTVLPNLSGKILSGETLTVCKFQVIVGWFLNSAANHGL